MIKDAIEKKLQHKIFLFYSNRRPKSPFLDELEKLARENLSFQLITTMTEPEKSVKLWQGETGKLSQSVLKKYVDNLESPIYYTAGLPEMIPHHVGAILMCEQTVIQDPEIQELCQTIISGQQAEIDQMKAKLEELQQ